MEILILQEQIDALIQIKTPGPHGAACRTADRQEI